MIRVLVVDDSKAVHSYVKECFAGTETTLEHAYDGQEAIEFLKDDSGTVDLIFLDWEMPRLPGPEFVVEFDKLGKAIPIIMVTSKNALEDITQMLEAGVSEYIMKPFTQDVLFEKIEQVLGRSVREDAAAA